MPSQYRNTPAYQWYVNGDASGNRHHAMPAFNTDNQGRVVLAAGEVFCRVSPDGGATLCVYRRKYSSLGALKKHIRSTHDIEIADSHPGGLKGRDDLLTAKYWKDIQAVTMGNEAEPQPPRKAKAVMKDQKLFPIPQNIGCDGTIQPNFLQMKANVGLGYSGRCAACAT